jgi:plastocyanin
MGLLGVVACGDSGSSGSGGGGPECTVDSDCPGTPCATAVCNQNACETVPTAQGTVLPTQVIGNCSRIVCDGQGSTTDVADATDVPSNMGACNTGSCEGAMPVQTPKAEGTPCATDGGVLCDGQGACVAALPTCTDTMSNGDETGVDCGGPTCPTCANGQACETNGDCSNDSCVSMICADPTCTDLVKNGDETDVDCGGTCTTKCGVGEGCLGDGDCTGQMCVGNVCVQVNGCDATNIEDHTGQANVTITQSGTAYTPKCIRVDVGTVVKIDAAYASHPLLGGEVVNNAKVPASSGPFVPITDTGTTKNFTMTTAGTFPYYCDVHALAGMTGAVFVQ